MPVMHPVDGVRVEPALAPAAMATVVMMVVRPSPKRHAHQGHDEWPQQISPYRLRHDILRQGRDCEEQ